MKKPKALVKLGLNIYMQMSINPREWEKRSIIGELWGILGCYNPPAVQCHQCKTHHCDQHKNIHKHKLK